MRRLLVGVGLTLGLVASTSSYADDCRPLISGLISSDAARQGRVTVIVVSMNLDGTASYSSIQLKPGWSSLALEIAHVPADVLMGRGKQLFNDRGTPPFDITHADDLQILVTNAPLITFTLLSWSKGKISLTPTCDGQLMTGSVPGRAYYILHFRTSDPT